MPELVGLAMPPGPGFVAALRRVWDDGDAAFPLDLRLPPAAAGAVLDAMAPAAVVDEHGRRHRRAASRPVEAGDALVVATSGTTGAPKGVVLTHAAVAASALATSEALAVDAGADTWLACLPLAHVGGLAVVTRALVTGTALVVHPGFDAAAVGAAARGGATLVSLVATALTRIDPTLFRAVLLGGSAPPEGLAPNVVTTYGMTETGSGVVYDGRPLPGVEVRVDPATSEVSVRGPMLLRAYRDGTDPKDPEGWLATGDAGSLDEAGRLTVRGRIAEVVVTGGEKVWPTAVEAVLARHPDVADVMVIGAADPEWGQRVVAVVVPREGAEPPSVEALRAFGRDHLPAYALPREVRVTDVLPRTTSGKLTRNDAG